MRLAIKVTPRAKRAKLDPLATPWRAWVTAPPVDGAANAAVIALVADYLHVPGSQIQIVHGHTDRLKMLDIPDGVGPQQASLL